MNTLQTERPATAWDPEPDDEEDDGPYCGLDDGSWNTQLIQAGTLLVDLDDGESPFGWREPWRLNPRRNPLRFWCQAWADPLYAAVAYPGLLAYAIYLVAADNIRKWRAR